ncbi:MAG: tryptophan-rich sensory protein [Chloroflexota bacterium]
MTVKRQSTTTNTDTLWSIITLVVIVLATLAANLLAFQTNADTGNIANETFNDVNYFFPATYVFTTIWPVIYTGIVGWAIFQALPANRSNPRYRAAAPWLMVNLILNATWVWIFGQEMFVATLPVMVLLVITIVIAYNKLEIGQTSVGSWERILQIPISIYLAWLTVATVANVAAALISVGWNGFGISPEIWTVVMLLVGAGLAYYLYRNLYRDWVILLVYVYAYVGIIIRYSDIQPVMIAASAGAAVLLFVFIWDMAQRRRSDLQPA